MLPGSKKFTRSYSKGKVITSKNNSKNSKQYEWYDTLNDSNYGSTNNILLIITVTTTIIIKIMIMIIIKIRNFRNENISSGVVFFHPRWTFLTVVGNVCNI